MNQDLLQFLKSASMFLLIAILFFVVISLMRDDYDMKVTNNGSVFRMNKKTGFIEYCTEVTDQDKKTYVLCFPEKKWDNTSYFKK